MYLLLLVLVVDDYVNDSEVLGHHSHSLRLSFDKLFGSFSHSLYTEQVRIIWLFLFSV